MYWDCLFVCRILKTGSTEKLSDEEIEDYLEKTVSLFSYLSDKDFFQDVYRNQLAKRLLNQEFNKTTPHQLLSNKPFMLQQFVQRQTCTK
jgi:hypothetical protein